MILMVLLRLIKRRFNDVNTDENVGKIAASITKCSNI